jgi:CTP:molybdopterin cytidylyltransferase MocA
MKEEQLEQRVNKIIGVLPMAGYGKRIQPIGFSKELYPIPYKGKHKAIADFSIESMLSAGAEEIKIVANTDKYDLMKYLSQKKFFFSIYPYNSRSLPESCLYPLPSIDDMDIVLFGLPDTMFLPLNAYSLILETLKENSFDIVLGLFRVDEPYKFDSVKFDDSTSIVTNVLVKQKPALSEYIWGLWAANRNGLVALKNEIDSQSVKNQSEKLLGQGFDSIAQKGHVKIGARILSDSYYDIGNMTAISGYS